MESVYCAVWAGSLSETDYVSSLEGIEALFTSILVGVSISVLLHYAMSRKSRTENAEAKVKVKVSRYRPEQALEGIR